MTTQRPAPRIWLDEPAVIGTADVALSDAALDGRIVAALRASGIDALFPIQQALLEHTADGGAQSICVAAPTGSGKTLAYLLPILRALAPRRVVRLRALIVVPGRELAAQVRAVLAPLAAALGLAVALCVGDGASFAAEQRALVGGAPSARRASDAATWSRVDVVVATPGRLLDHLEGTPGFTLKYVEWLVLDEADRLIEGAAREWLQPLFRSLHGGGREDGAAPSASFRLPHHQQDGAAAAAKEHRRPYRLPSCWCTPLRTLLFSATLTRNPAKLAALHLGSNPLYLVTAAAHRPALSTTQQDSDLATHESDLSKHHPAHQYALPASLTEYIYVCPPERKPVLLLYLLGEGAMTRALCFVKSVEATERLCILLRAAAAAAAGRARALRIEAFSGSLGGAERRRMLEAFEGGEIDLLICSDAAARGIDLSCVEAVINYDAPPHVKTYIHRVGRTARANRAGRAYTIVAYRDVFPFKQMVEGGAPGRLAHFQIPAPALAAIEGSLAAAIAAVTTDGAVDGVDDERSIHGERDAEPVLAYLEGRIEGLARRR